MALLKPRFDNIQARVLRAKDLTEGRDLLAELMMMPNDHLFRLFDVAGCPPQEVHKLRDRIFTGVVGELVRNGWNCNLPSFGMSRRDTFLMESARRGFSQAVDFLLGIGADADYNSRGHGASTALMTARDPAVVKKLLDCGANPMELNADNQTDFTYKMLAGASDAVMFYFRNTERIALQPLLDNLRECLTDRDTIPFNPMYPLCILPALPKGSAYKGVIDTDTVDAMFRKQFLPFSPDALKYEMDGGTTVWSYIRSKMNEAPNISAPLLAAYLACMSRGPEFQSTADFMCVENYVEKQLPRDMISHGVISKSMFVFMLFSLASLPTESLLRWLIMLGRIVRRLALWMDIYGDEPFRVTTHTYADATVDRSNMGGNSNLLQELSSMQTLLSMRVSIPNGFGEFRLPNM